MDEGSVRGMQRHPRARALPDPAGEPVVVGMDVGDEHTLYVGDVEPRRGQPPAEHLEGIIGVPPGVDQVRPLVGLEGVHEHVPQRIVRDRNGNAPQPGPHPLDGRKRLLHH